MNSQPTTDSTQLAYYYIHTCTPRIWQMKLKLHPRGPQRDCQDVCLSITASKRPGVEEPETAAIVAAREYIACSSTSLPR